MTDILPVSTGMGFGNGDGFGADALGMVYSDFYKMYKDEEDEKYFEHAYLFLCDKDYKGRYAKEKWYARK